MSSTAKITWQNQYSVIAPQINAEGIHLWPFDVAFPMDVQFFSHASKDVRMNRHDYFELLFLYSGESVLQIQDQRFTLTEGDLVVIGSGLLHRMIEFHKPEIRVAVLYFLPEIFGTEVSLDAFQYLLPFKLQGPAFPHVISAKTGTSVEVFDFVQRIYNELSGKSQCSRLCTKAYLRTILALLVKHYAAHPGTREGFNGKYWSINRLRRLFDHIDQHYGESITVRDAASIVYMSDPHLMRFFKEATGQTFHEYLTRYRIGKAQTLLTTTDKSIAEVSQEVGFYDQSSFGLAFRKLVKMTPREYRHRLDLPALGERPNDSFPIPNQNKLAK